MEYIAFDAHQHYTLASVVRPNGNLVREERIEHDRGSLREFLERGERGSPVAVETIGNWYWIVDEIEAAGCVPKLVHARKAKLMMGEINKTDRLDAGGSTGCSATARCPRSGFRPGSCGTGTVASFHLTKGDWGRARDLIEHAVAVFRNGNVVLQLPLAVARSAWVLAQIGEAQDQKTERADS